MTRANLPGLAAKSYRSRRLRGAHAVLNGRRCGAHACGVRERRGSAAFTAGKNRRGNRLRAVWNKNAPACDNMPDVRPRANEKPPTARGRCVCVPPRGALPDVRLRANEKVTHSAEKVRLRLRGDHSAAEEKTAPRGARGGRFYSLMTMLPSSIVILPRCRLFSFK